MPAVTQFGSHVGSNSIPNTFNVTDLTDIYKKKLALLIEDIFNELALESSLNFFQHPAHSLINLPEDYMFGSIIEF